MAPFFKQFTKYITNATRDEVIGLLQNKTVFISVLWAVCAQAAQAGPWY